MNKTNQKIGSHNKYSDLDLTLISKLKVIVKSHGINPLDNSDLHSLIRSIDDFLLNNDLYTQEELANSDESNSLQEQEVMNPGKAEVADKARALSRVDKVTSDSKNSSSSSDVNTAKLTKGVDSKESIMLKDKNIRLKTLKETKK